MAADNSNARRDPSDPTAETRVSDTLPRTFDQGLRRPTQVGPYKLLEVLGEGGMGAVYLAEQEKPVRRRVALKLIKVGMDTAEVITRFESERQALAMMNHPSIAQVYDAGTTDSGRPYFVMEHVPGVPITEYCDTHRLSTRQRLELFTQVCHAVQHAHQKGIIHRDIKPSNVLVMFQDAQPVPKIIDFGIARATDHRLTGNANYTEHGRLIGTPEYMSPEQAEMTGLDIDTRTDVYSLGVLLYELLVGTLPFESQGLRQQGPNAMRQQIREMDPPTPSTRISTLGKDSHVAAQKRQTDARALVKQIRGDLDWITMKAMEKDRTLRYSSAAELAADITRFLNDEPVTAGPPGAAYRLKKLMRKHRRIVGAVVAVMLALLVGIAVSTALYFKAQRETNKALVAESEAQKQRDAAEQARAAEAKQHSEADRQRDAALQSKQLAVAENARARAVDEFLNGMLSSLDKDQLKVADVMERASGQIDAIFADQPEVAATLRERIGITYYRIGLYKKAEPQFRSALDIRQRILPRDHRDTLRSMSKLGCLLMYDKRFEEAEPLLKNAFERQKNTIGEDDSDSLDTMNSLAGLLAAQGNLDAAEQLDRRVLEYYRSKLGPEDPATLNTMNNLATVLKDDGKYADAEDLLRSVLEIRKRRLGEKNPDRLFSMANLAGVLQAECKFDEAENLARRALEGQKMVHGLEHPITQGSMSTLGHILMLESKFSEAEPLLRRVYDFSEQLNGREHAATLESGNSVANVLYELNELPEAEALCRRVLEAREKQFGSENTDTLESLCLLARILMTKGELSQAESMYRRALEIRKRVQGPDTSDALATMNDLGTVLLKQQKLDDAEPLLRSALDGRKKLFKDENGQTLTSQYNLASLLQSKGNTSDAEALLKQNLQLRENLLGKENKDTVDTVAALALVLYLGGKNEEAEPLFRRALESKKRILPPDHPETLQSWVYLASVYFNSGRYEDSIEAYRQIASAYERRHDEDDSDLLETLSCLGEALTAKGRFDEAELPLVKSYERMRVSRHVTVATIRSTLERLIGLYEKWGNEEKAAAYRAKLSALGK